MKLDELFNQQSAWLRGIGSDSDVVVSSRIRLARNIDEFPFVNRATEAEQRAILEKVKAASDKIFDASSIFYLDFDDVSRLDRQVLLERQLISKDLVEAEYPCAAIIDKKEEFCIMVNEEDHLRIQRMCSGFELRQLWAQTDELDNQLENELSFAFDQKLGYLTACPSNVGTGIRVSVMLHIPGLVETGEAERVFRGLQKINLAVRGIYGEGSNALGEFFQISNQTTLGRCEEELIAQLCEVVPRTVEYERKAREHLLENYHSRLLDKCCRAMAILQTAHTMTLEESMEYLSSVRLGIHLNLIKNFAFEDLNEIMLLSQSAHLKRRLGRVLEGEEESVARADFFRLKFKEK